MISIRRYSFKDSIKFISIKNYILGQARKVMSRIRTMKKARQITLHNCSISPKASLHEPCNMAEVSVGDYTYISPNSKVSRTTIKKFCSIGPDLRCGWGLHPIHGISTAPMFYSTGKQNGTTLVTANKFEERKQITIGNDVFIGMNVLILDGVTIGDGAVIGAGAVVSKDIPPYAIAVGIPIKVIKYRFSQDIIDQLLEIKWWDQDESVLQKVAEHCFDIDSFLREMKKVKASV